jgi:hypothetical protein
MPIEIPAMMRAFGYLRNRAAHISAIKKSRTRSILTSQLGCASEPPWCPLRDWFDFEIAFRTLRQSGTSLKTAFVQSSDPILTNGTVGDVNHLCERENAADCPHGDKNPSLDGPAQQNGRSSLYANVHLCLTNWTRC